MMTKTRTGGEARRTGRSVAATWGRRIPFVFFLLALAIAGIGALEAYRTQRSHAATTSSLLEDYGGFAAFTYQQRSWQLLGEAIQSRLAIARENQAFRFGHVAEQCLSLILDEPGDGDGCGCAAPITGAYSFFTRVGEGPERSIWAGTAPDEAVRTRLLDQVHRHARETYGDNWTYALAHLGGAGNQAQGAAGGGSPDDGGGGAADGGVRPTIVAYTLIEAPLLDTSLVARTDSVIYGFEVDEERLAALFARALDDEVLLPPSLTRDRPNSEVIAVEVIAPSGRVLYASRPGGDLAFASETAQRENFGGGVIRASVLPAVADQLIIGGLPRDRTPLFVLIFGMAGALAVLAILQLRREDRLALLRQDFVASVSHELRTPLAQVRLFTETLQLGRTETEEQRVWALGNIDRETQRLTNLVDNILHFSRSERGVSAVDPEPGDLTTAVAEAIASFQRLIPDGKAILELDVPDRLPAELDADAIRQVLLNLLDNAVRYGPSGQVIRVSGTRLPDAVRIAVEDGGPGVPLADRERIFEPFLRGNHALGTVVVGSGIGLSVVREIVAAHGGRVWVEDSENGGARFVFELPALHTVRERQLSPTVEASARQPGAA